MDLTPILRLSILTALAAILALLFAAPLVRVRRETGSWPVALHRVRVPGQIPVVAALGAILVTETLLVLVYAAHGPVALGVWPAPTLLPLLGVVLAASGIAFVAVAERQMGASYRFGIDDQPTELVRHGLFAVVRNPIYTGILAILGGLAFIAPCLWTVLLWPAAALGFARQARLEERHLLAMHGGRYREYASRVGRFLPGIGRLARDANEVLDHYDRFPFLVDLFRDWPYREARAAAIEELDLQPGDRVVDLFCGTGVNFEPLLAGIGPTGRVIGVDGSEGMLARARRRIQRRRLPAERIDLRQIDVAQQRDALREVFAGSPGPPKLLITLALGCFPNYDEVFGDIYRMLPAGTRVVVMEGYFERRSLACRVLDWIGAADCTRRTWEPLERRVSDYRRIDFPLRFSTVVVASGTKT